MEPLPEKAGDRVRWRSLNHDHEGTVVKVTPRGALVAVDGGGYILASTAETIRAAQKRSHDKMYVKK